MKHVQLSLRNSDSELLETLDGQFQDCDFVLLHQYDTHVSRVRATELIKRGMPSITNMRWTADEGTTYTCAPCSNSELHELLHVLRPLILESEPASFARITALLMRRFSSKRFSAYVKEWRRIFDDGELSLYMQIAIDGKPLLHQSMLHTWLNGTQYHTDAEKASAWEQLERSLEAENARALVLSQLHSKVKAIFHMQYLVSLALKDGNAA